MNFVVAQDTAQHSNTYTQCYSAQSTIAIVIIIRSEQINTIFQLHNIYTLIRRACLGLCSM